MPARHIRVVLLDHSQGQCEITIAASTDRIAEHLATSIRVHFSQSGARHEAIADILDRIVGKARS